MTGSGVGETRRIVKEVTVQFPMTVTIGWPEGIPFDSERATEIAVAMCHQNDEVNVGPVGRIVWAQRYSECDQDEAEIIEEIDIEPRQFWRPGQEKR